MLFRHLIPGSTSVSQLDSKPGFEIVSLSRKSMAPENNHLYISALCQPLTCSVTFFQALRNLVWGV
jgi:hypothetical protein